MDRVHRAPRTTARCRIRTATPYSAGTGRTATGAPFNVTVATPCPPLWASIPTIVHYFRIYVAHSGWRRAFRRTWSNSAAMARASNSTAQISSCSRTSGTRAGINSSRHRSAWCRNASGVKIDLPHHSVAFGRREILISAAGQRKRQRRTKRQTPNTAARTVSQAKIDNAAIMKAEPAVMLVHRWFDAGSSRSGGKSS
jgi:hypothetical protein